MIFNASYRLLLFIIHYVASSIFVEIFNQCQLYLLFRRAIQKYSQWPTEISIGYTRKCNKVERFARFGTTKLKLNHRKILLFVVSVFWEYFRIANLESVSKSKHSSFNPDARFDLYLKLHISTFYPFLSLFFQTPLRMRLFLFEKGFRVSQKENKSLL